MLCTCLPHSSVPSNPNIEPQVTKARAATLHLPHGPVPLPIFMPVATQASLKGLTPEQLEEQGCRLCLNNTYHLYIAPTALEISTSDTGERS